MYSFLKTWFKNKKLDDRTKSIKLYNLQRREFRLIIDYDRTFYLFILAGLSNPGALQYDVIGETGDEVDSSIPTPPRLSTSPPCFMYTGKQKDQVLFTLSKKKNVKYMNI